MLEQTLLSTHHTVTLPDSSVSQSLTTSPLQGAAGAPDLFLQQPAWPAEMPLPPLPQPRLLQLWALQALQVGRRPAAQDAAPLLQSQPGLLGP